MSDVTPHLGLPLIAAGQAQKHVTHNEALAMLDGLIQMACLDKDLTAPPASPTEGDRYLVAAPQPTGAWAGLSGQVVRFSDGVWIGLVPAAGWMVYLADEKAVYVFDGRSWGTMSSNAVMPASVDRLGVGTQPDPTNRFAVKSDAALFSWDEAKPGSGDMRVTVNKRAPGKDAGLVFQTGWSSRALFGTLGGDDVVLKTSPDGATFKTAFTAAAGTGLVSFPASPLGPTPNPADNSARLATTAYVDRAISAVDPGAGWVLVSDFDYAAKAGDRTIVFTRITAARAVFLPPAASVAPGRTLSVIDQAGQAGPWQAITLKAAQGDGIGGSGSIALTIPYGSLTLQSDGVNRWTVLTRSSVPLAKTFTDVLNDVDVQKMDSSFRRLSMPVVVTDPGRNWDAANSLYTCPRSGIYQIVANVRLKDSTEAGAQCGLGVSTLEVDGPWMNWQAVGTGRATRTSCDYTRVSFQNQGEQLRLFAYTEPAVGITIARLQIILLSEPG